MIGASAHSSSHRLPCVVHNVFDFLVFSNITPFYMVLVTPIQVTTRASIAESLSEIAELHGKGLGPPSREPIAMSAQQRGACLTDGCRSRRKGARRRHVCEKGDYQTHSHVDLRHATHTHRI